MNIRSRIHGSIVLKNPCPHDLAILFSLVADQIEAGDVKNFKILTEKNSGSQILYSVSERNSLTPVAVMHDNCVSKMPFVSDPKSPEAIVGMIELDKTLRAIALSFTPA